MQKKKDNPNSHAMYPNVLSNCYCFIQSIKASCIVYQRACQDTTSALLSIQLAQLISYV